MNYTEALEYIHSLSHGSRRKRPLDATAALLNKLGSPHRRLRFVHVAGTNGKGSTSAMIESALRAAGYRTGLFTSPFISRFNERIRVDGADIGDEELAELVTELRPVIEAETEPVTEFEFVTVLGLTYFIRKNCSVVVLEAGLGGRNDYTNVIESPELCVFTAIGLDHTLLLGDTVEKIAGEKAGIIKRGCAAVSFGNSEEAERVIKARCLEVGAEYRRADMSGLHIISSGANSSLISFDGLEGIRLPLAGSYQPYNAATAITALRELSKRGWHIPDEAVRNGLEEVVWRGRFELLDSDPAVILDGAHNPQACRATVDSLISLYGGRRLVFVTAVMADKDVDGIISELLRASRLFIAVPLDYPRSLSKEALCEKLRERGAEAVAADSASAGVALARTLAGREGVVCCLGTLYFQNEIRDTVGRKTQSV